MATTIDTRAAADTDRFLFAAGVLFTVAVLVHNGDHLRRGAGSVASDVFVAGTLGVILEVGVVALICARHRLAPLAALAVGASLAPAYLLVHFTPERSWLSDSFPGGTDVSAMSWFAAGFEVVAAVGLAISGWTVLQERGGLQSATQHIPGERTLREGLLHPLAFVFLVLNLTVVAVSVVQL